jgi:hypothetical protein
MEVDEGWWVVTDLHNVFGMSDGEFQRRFIEVG